MWTGNVFFKFGQNKRSIMHEEKKTKKKRRWVNVDVERRFSDFGI